MWTKRVGDGVEVAYPVGTWIRMERRAPDGNIVWAIAVLSPSDKVDVSQDCRSLSVNAAAINLPEKLYVAEVRPESIMVVVYPSTQNPDRNVYQYDRSGRLRWQIG